MGQRAFTFKNQELRLSSQRPKPLSEKAIKRLILISSGLALAGLLSLKIFKLSGRASQTAAQKPAPALSEKESYMFPLLVNLKGKEGPRLARARVRLTLKEGIKKKYLLSQNKEIEKWLLFILSGQPAEALSRKKDHIENQIQSQLNAFLDKKAINKVRVQIQALN